MLSRCATRCSALWMGMQSSATTSAIVPAPSPMKVSGSVPAATTSMTRKRSLKHTIGYITHPEANLYPYESEKEPVAMHGLERAVSVRPLKRLASSCVECSECGLMASGYVIAAHALTTHAHKPYACTLCGRCFGEKGNLNKHHRTVHLKERRYGCPCGKTFAFQDGLKRHIAMVHLDQRPHLCTYCMCEGDCSSTSAPGVPGRCMHICGMRFKQLSHLRRHIHSVHRAVSPTHTVQTQLEMEVAEDRLQIP